MTLISIPNLFQNAQEISRRFGSDFCSKDDANSPLFKESLEQKDRQRSCLELPILEQIGYILVLITYLSSVSAYASPSESAPAEQSSITYPVSPNPSQATPSLPPLPKDKNQETPPPAPLEEVPSMLSHRATYEISLNKVDADCDVSEVKGQIVLEIIERADGWALKEQVSVMIYHIGSEADQVLSDFKAFESRDRQQYTFESRAYSNDGKEEKTSGRVENMAAFYDMPYPQRVSLPQGALFPIKHRLMLLKAAMKGDRVFSSTVFDGASETHEAVDVNTIIESIQASKLSLGDQKLYQPKKMWAVRMGIYPFGYQGAEPEQEMLLHIMDQGVIKDFIMDLGNFTMKATLKNIEVFNDSASAEPLPVYPAEPTPPYAPH